jgi:hypothetical protein
VNISPIFREVLGPRCQYSRGCTLTGAGDRLKNNPVNKLLGKIMKGNCIDIQDTVLEEVSRSGT